MQMTFLQEANLREAYLRRTHLQHAFLIRADLYKANLHGAYLQGANLQGANFQGATRTDCLLSVGTHQSSDWPPPRLLEWRDQGAHLVNFPHAWPLEVAQLLQDTREGLTLHFHTRLTPIDRIAVEMVVGTYLEATPHSDCRIAEFRELPNDRALLRLESSNLADLETIADALHTRAWENAPSGTHLQLARDLHALSGPRLLNQLSWLMDRGDRTELHTLEDGKLVCKWSKPHTTAKAPALARLLRSLFKHDALERHLAHEPDGQEILDHLPGGNATYADVAAAAVDHLQRTGLLGQSFFIRLGRARPRRQGEVAFAARLWGIELPPTLVLDGE